ncbi:MAG: HIT family protein [Candidatus Binatia bacterium]
MQVLWAPWRMTYIAGPRESGCIFCLAADATDPRHHLALVQRPAVVMLNKFPYTHAHLLVAPRTHVADLSALSSDESHALMDTLRRAAAVLADTFHPDGMNIGMNLGTAAGAGIADHLHFHIVPRWVGDTNFMPMLADVRVMPEHLDATYDRLRPRFAARAPA